MSKQLAGLDQYAVAKEYHTLHRREDFKRSKLMVDSGLDEEDRAAIWFIIDAAIDTIPETNTPPIVGDTARI